MSEDWRKWLPVCERLLYQCFYRVLSFISVHTSVENVYNCVKEMSSGWRGGRVYWLLRGRVAKWDDFQVFPGIRMSIWIFGGPRNAVYARRGWWTLYLFDIGVERLARALGTLEE